MSEFWPEIGLAPRIPVVIACGPPASGKSTYAMKRADPGDVVVDMDVIVKEIGGVSRTDDWGVRGRALSLRNKKLNELYKETTGRAWFITTCPTGFARERWARMLRTDEVLVFLTCIEECRERIRTDRGRSRYLQSQEEILEKWWRQYYPSKIDSNRNCRCERCA